MSKISIYDVVPVPKLADKLIGTSVGGEIEDITYNFTLGELLNLFIPNIPANTLQGVLDYGNTATQDINLIGAISTTNLTVTNTANILNSNLTGDTRVTGGLYDRTNSKGTAGQVLRSTGTQVEWYTIPTVVPTLQQVLASGNTSDINIILTSNIEAVTVTGSSVVSSTNLSVLGTLRDKDASVGVAGQILSSTGTKVQWVNAPIYTASSPLFIDAGTRNITIQKASSTQDGYLSSVDWISFDGKQSGISLTTVGSSGAASFIASVLNIPNYTLAGLGGVPESRTLSINGVTYDLSANRSWVVDGLPAQAGNNGKYLTTDGTNASWGTINLSGYVPTSRTLTINGTTYDLSADRSWTIGSVTSVGLSMPNAFGVANSPITSSGTLAVTALGTASQYIRGDGELATFPSTSSGGSSVNYYLNGSVNSSVAGYKQLGNTATIGAGTDFTLTGNGLIAQFLTDVGNPNRIEIPGGAWNFEMFFQVSSSGGNQKFYVELLKYDGTTFTSIASSSAIPEQITGGTAIDLYLTSLAVPTTTLLVTDRLAIRVYIVDNSGGRTVTLHTEDNTLCEIITTFAGGISALNGLTANTQYFATGTSGTDFGISSVSDTHTFNLPTASATNRGALSSADWSTFNGKLSGSGVANQLTYWNGTGSVTGSSNLIWDNTRNGLGIGSTISAWNTNYRLIQFPGGALFSPGSTPNIYIGSNLYLDSGFTSRYVNNGFAGYAGFNNGTFVFSNAVSGVAGNAITLPTQMTLTNAGRLLLGTTTESTFILDVNGTARVSGNTRINATDNLSTSYALEIYNQGGSILCRLNNNGTQALFLGGAATIGTRTINAAANYYIGYAGGLAWNIYNGSPVYIWTINNVGADVAVLAAKGSNGVKIALGVTDTYSASALLELESTTKGFLPPRMTSTQRDAIASPATGLSIYNTTTNTNDIYNGTAWSALASGNIYTANGTLTGNRTISSGGFSLTINPNTTFSSGKINITETPGGSNSINVAGTVASENLMWITREGQAFTNFALYQYNTMVFKGNHNPGAGVGNMGGGNVQFNTIFGEGHKFKDRVGLSGQYLFGRGFVVDASNTASIGIGNGSDIFGGDIQLVINSAANVYFGKVTDGNASKTDAMSTLHGISGTGTDNVGKNFRIAAGRGTGSANAGDLLFMTANAGTTGTTLQTLQYRMGIFGNTGNVIIGSGGTFVPSYVDAGFKLDVQGTARVSGNFDGLSISATGSANGRTTSIGTFVDFQSTHGRLFAYNFNTSAWLPILTGSSRLIMSTALGSRTEGLVGNSASFSGDVKMLSQQNFFGATENNGIFAPTTYSNANFPVIENNSIGIIAGASGISNPAWIAATKISFQIGSGTNSKIAQFSATTGNLILQGGGTFTDAGYRLDVFGNGRFTGNLTAIATTASVTAGILGWSAVNGYVQTTIPASTSFTAAGYAFSSLIGNNYMTYQGSATFAADTFIGSIVGINNIAFTAASSTITITQSSSIRTYSAGLYQNTISGAVDGTITHLSGLAVRPLFRASGTSTITVTNNYGLLIADQNEYNHATITNRWGVYQEGANDNNYFRGKVILGTSNTVGASVLNINGLPTSSSGLSTGDIWNDGGILKIA